MPGAVKARELTRDGRFALHANPGDGSMQGGDAKVSGVAGEVTDPAAKAAAVGGEQPPGPFHLFRLDITEVVLTSVEGDQLVIQVWRPGRPVRRHQRS
ncbi:MAG: hypothetical protein ACRDQ7_12155 [Haloechinothrix sp.]